MCLRPLTPAEGANRVAEAKQLAERITGANVEEKQAGLTGVVQFAEAVGQPAEPYLIPLMPEVLRALAEKVCVVIRGRGRILRVIGAGTRLVSA